jgi:hypothetical protein
MDYPKFDKNSKFTSSNICSDFIGQCTSFVLFEDQISNVKKFIQLHAAYPYGIHSNALLKSLKPEIFEKKVTDKILLFYSPVRTASKLVYDAVNSNDAAL